MVMPALYLTSIQPSYGPACNREFSGKVLFVPRGHLGVAVDETRNRYPRGTLMAVDDQPIMREFYRTALQGSKMSLDFHTSPLEALEALRGGRTPDAIFSAAGMRQMHGFDFMREVLKVYASE